MKRLVPAALVACAAACGVSHVVDGGADAANVDAGPDSGIALPDADCDLVAEYRPCGSRCPVSCTDSFCSEPTGVCLPRYTHPEHGGEVVDFCDFTIGTGSGTQCFTGLPCATAGQTCAADEPAACGACVSDELCVAATAAGLPITGCTWSDGTPVVRGAPSATCAESPDAREPFCGGACGTSVACTTSIDFAQPFPIPCVGVSDDRGFGLCPLSYLTCGPASLLPDASPWVLSTCERDMGEACACLVPLPQPDLGLETFGWPTLSSVCVAYRDAHPGHVECRDTTGSLIP